MKTKISLWSAFVFTLIMSQTFGQTAPTIEWQKTTGGSLDEDFGFLPNRNVIQTSTGGYLVGGSSKSPISGEKTQASQGGFDYWIVYLDGSGTVQWDKRYGGSGDDFLSSIVECDDGGFLIGGSSYSEATGDKTTGNFGNCLSCGGGSDFWVLKIDVDGNIEWDKSYGGVGADRLDEIRKTDEGDYLLAGSTYTTGIVGGNKTDSGNGAFDYYLVKINSDGVKKWDYAYGSGGHDEDGNIIITNDGHYLLGGSSESGIGGDRSETSQGASDYWILLLDTSGTKIWDKRFGGSAADQLTALVQADDSGFLIGGYTQSSVSGDVTQDWRCGISGDAGDYWVIRIDDEGAALWDARFGTAGNEGLDKLEQILPTNDGGFILGGQGGNGPTYCDRTTPQGGSDCWLIKIDDSGVKQWEDSYGGNITEVFSAFEHTSDGGYIMMAYSNSPVSGKKNEASRGGFDLWTVKLSCESPPTWYLDNDDDGYGNPAVSVLSCSPPDDFGWIDNNLDCNDDNASIHPGAADLCNGIDDNCDNVIDENMFVASVTPGGTVSICDGSSILLTANFGNGISYQWLKGNKSIAGANGPTYLVKKGAKYKVKETNSFGCMATSPVTTVTVNPAPAATISATNLDLCQGAVVLMAIDEGLWYSWLKGSAPIPGATNQTFTATQKGTYKVVVTDPETGCSKTSAGKKVVKTCKESSADLEVNDDALFIYPNPGSGNFTLEYTATDDESLAVKVYDVLGREVFSSHEEVTAGIYTRQLDLSNLPSGTYYLKVIHDGASEMRKVVIEK